MFEIDASKVEDPLLVMLRTMLERLEEYPDTMEEKANLIEECKKKMIKLRLEE